MKSKLLVSMALGGNEDFRSDSNIYELLEEVEQLALSEPKLDVHVRLFRGEVETFAVFVHCLGGHCSVVPSVDQGLPTGHGLQVMKPKSVRHASFTVPFLAFQEPIWHETYALPIEVFGEASEMFSKLRTAIDSGTMKGMCLMLPEDPDSTGLTEEDFRSSPHVYDYDAW